MRESDSYLQEPDACRARSIFEIHADDPARAQRFYETIFDWQFQKVEQADEDYWLITTGPDDQRGINGGLLPTHLPPEPPVLSELRWTIIANLRSVTLRGTVTVSEPAGIFGEQPRRVSHERAAVEALSKAVGQLPGVMRHTGYRPDNRLDVEGWQLAPLQYIQFGDLRYEADRIRVVVEVESGGGVGNLVKYWPLLPARLSDKPFFLLHLFRLGSENDYVAHRRLWSFLCDRMKDDLQTRCAWEESWYATMGTYRRTEDVATHATLIRLALDQGLTSVIEKGPG